MSAPMWIKLKIENAVASDSWNYTDFKWCWYWKLLIQQARGKGTGIPGYLPNDEALLWEIAGAKTRWYFVGHGGREVLRRHFQATSDGKYLFNPIMLQVVTEAIAKQQKVKTDSKLDSSLSISSEFDVGFDFVLTDIDELKVVGDKVFAYYMEKFRRDSRYKFTPARRKKFELRVCEILPDCKTIVAAGKQAMCAIDNLSKSEFHVNGGFFDWIDHIFKSREVFEKRLAMVGKAPSLVDKLLTEGMQRGGSDVKQSECWHCGEVFDFDKPAPDLNPDERGFCGRVCADEYGAWKQEASRRGVTMDVIRREKRA